jgi:hypothetical protein
MKRPLIGGKDFKTSIGQGEQAQGGVMEGGQVFLTLTKEDLMCFWEEKEEDECVRKNLVLMCGKIIVHEKNKMCANKEHGRKLCVASNCSGVDGRISVKKPLDSYFKQLFFSNPPLDLSQTLNNFSLRGVECSPKISASSDLLQGNYTCRK